MVILIYFVLKTLCHIYELHYDRPQDKVQRLTTKKCLATFYCLLLMGLIQPMASGWTCAGLVHSVGLRQQGWVLLPL